MFKATELQVCVSRLMMPAVYAIVVQYRICERTHVLMMGNETA